MTKTINLELSERLVPYLKNFKTEYTILLNKETGNLDIAHRTEILGNRDYKYGTLTAGEAIDFIAKQTDGFIFIYKKSNIIKFSYLYAFMEKLKDGSIGRCLASGDTYLKSIEEMLEYLLDNNLLGKKNNI